MYTTEYVVRQFSKPPQALHEPLSFGKKSLRMQISLTELSLSWTGRTAQHNVHCSGQRGGARI